MKNDIRLIKDDLINKTNGKQTKEQKKKHDDLLKQNLYTTIIYYLKYKNKSCLSVLEDKEKIIIEALKETRKQELKAKEQDNIKFDSAFEDNFKNKSKQDIEEQDIYDYNYLYDIFITIFTKIEKEQKLIEKYKKEEEFKKLDKIISNVIFNDLEKASKESNKTIKTLINAIDNSEYKAYLLEHIKNTCEDEFKEEHIKARIKANIKNIKDDFKNDIEEEPEEKHKLPLSWRLYFALKALEALIK